MRQLSIKPTVSVSTVSPDIGQYDPPRNRVEGRKSLSSARTPAFVRAFSRLDFPVLVYPTGCNFLHVVSRRAVRRSSAALQPYRFLLQFKKIRRRILRRSISIFFPPVARADTAPEPRQGYSLARKPRKRILQLGELHRNRPSRVRPPKISGSASSGLRPSPP